MKPSTEKNQTIRRTRENARKELESRSMDERDEKPESLDRLWDADLEVLGELLDQLEEDGAMCLEELDGFLAALHCSPTLVAPTECLSEIVGDGFDNAEIFPNEDSVQLFLNLLMRHWNEVGTAFASQDFFIPLLLEDEEGKAYGNNWALGFMRGVDMRKDAWRELFEDEDKFARFVPILALVHELDPDPEMRSYEEPISDEQREELLAGVAASVTEIYRYFAPHRRREADFSAEPVPVRSEARKIGRNDPCYCGSGKKYKKCCGGLAVN
jgi:uncharacterized protein